MVNKIINKIIYILKNYPVWDIFGGVLTTSYTIYWLICAWCWKYIANHTNDYFNYMEYDINFVHTIVFAAFSGLGSILFWLDVYKFFKNNK